MKSGPRSLHVVTYHYIRDLSATRFSRLKVLVTKQFRAQVELFASRFEMCSLDKALNFLDGAYEPARDLCMLTFDDGLKEHYTEVAPFLAERNIQGLFGVITSCIEDRTVAPVHMNHFLMAAMQLETYKRLFLERVYETDSSAPKKLPTSPAAERFYPLDGPEVAAFKYFLNYSIDPLIRDAVIRALFEEVIGNESEFAEKLYMTWSELREMQAAGMLVAGHTHRHRPLSVLSDAELREDLWLSRSLMNKHLRPQQLWPFSFPYGKLSSYSLGAIRQLREYGFACAFNTETGANTPGAPLFELRRIDCNGATEMLGVNVETQNQNTY